LVRKQQSSNRVVRTFVVDAEPFGHLMYQAFTHQPSLYMSIHADVLLLLRTSRSSRSLRLIGTETTIIQPCGTYVCCRRRTFWSFDVPSIYSPAFSHIESC
jgi:hypothetical protein